MRPARSTRLLKAFLACFEAEQVARRLPAVAERRARDENVREVERELIGQVVERAAPG